jgi:hypothetical protein
MAGFSKHVLVSGVMKQKNKRGRAWDIQGAALLKRVAAGNE